MANQNIQMKHYNGTEWDSLFPKTLASLVEMNDATTVQQTLENILTDKVDVVAGKGLSTNDFTDELMTKLNNMESAVVSSTQPTDSGLNSLWFEILS